MVQRQILARQREEEENTLSSCGCRSLLGQETLVTRPRENNVIQTHKQLSL